MKKIINIWILFSIIMISFAQGNGYDNMDTKMNQNSSSCHSETMSIDNSDTCDYVCNSVFLHNNKTSLDVLSSHSLNITFSSHLANLTVFKPFKPPIHIL